MRIGIVCYPTFGGSGVVATELGMTLANRGHNIHFITYKQPVRLSLLNDNIHFHEVNISNYSLFHYQPYELALSSKLVDMVKLHAIEVLHVHYAIPHAYAAYMAKKMLEAEGIKIPIVTTLHGTDITLVGNHPSYKPAVTFSINNSDIVTSVSQSLKDDTKRFFNVDKEIHVVPNFIDPSKYENTITNCQRSIMAKDEEKIITHVSNFRKVKRIDDVIQIFNGIQSQIPSKLLMVGDGPEKEKAEKLCVSLGIEDKVMFLGNSLEVYKILRFSDLFLLPSETESFGFAALEAMVNNTPVISSNSGGIPEVNEHGYSGFLSNVGNIDEMIANAILILENENTLEKFKEQAKKQAFKFNLEAIVSQYENLYAMAYKDVLNLN